MILTNQPSQNSINANNKMAEYLDRIQQPVMAIDKDLTYFT